MHKVSPQRSLERRVAFSCPHRRKMRTAETQTSAARDLEACCGASGPPRRRKKPNPPKSNSLRSREQVASIHRESEKRSSRKLTRGNKRAGLLDPGPLP